MILINVAVKGFLTFLVYKIVPTILADIPTIKKSGDFQAAFAYGGMLGIITVMYIAGMIIPIQF